MKSSNVIPKTLLAGSSVFALVMALYTPKSMLWAVLGGSVASSVAVGMVQGSKHQRQRNSLEDKLSKSTRELTRIKRTADQVEGLKADIFTLSAQLQTLQDENSQLKVLREKMETAYKALQSSSMAESLSLKSAIAVVETSKESQRVEMLAQIDDLKIHLADVIAEWDESTQLKARELSVGMVEAELETLHQTWDSRIDSLVRLFQELSKLFQVSSERQEMLKNGFLVQEDNFNEQTENVRRQLDEILTETTTREGQLQAQIDSLQAYQDGIYTEPVYLDKRFNSLFQAANGVIRILHEDLGVTCKGLGAVASDNGDCKVGIQLSAQLEPINTVKGLNERRKQIQDLTKLPVLDHFVYCETTNTVTFTLRNAPRTANINRSKLYRSSSDFLNAVLGGRLFIRLVGSPGSGKTPTLAVLLSKILERGFHAGNMPTGARLQHLKIEMCNPLQGISVKNSDDVLDTFTAWDSASEALKGLSSEYARRKDVAEKIYRESSGYLWICDEFDNAVAGMTPSDLQGFGKLLKDGGHLNMGAIVLGQSVMVSKSKNLSIEDQKMFTNVLLDGVSIRSFLEMYGNRFYSEDVVTRTKNLYAEIETLIESDNAMIVDSARQLRIGLVLAEKSPVFYELPYFDGVEIDTVAYQNSLSALAKKTDGIRTVQTSQSIAVKAETVATSTDGKDGTDGTTEHYRGLAVVAEIGTKPVCKVHPSSELKLQAGNRWYCSECKKKLTKKEIHWG